MSWQQRHCTTQRQPVTSPHRELPVFDASQWANRLTYGLAGLIWSPLLVRFTIDLAGLNRGLRRLAMVPYVFLDGSDKSGETCGASEVKRMTVVLAIIGEASNAIF